MSELAERRERRERVVREHMESENVQEWERTIATFSHPRYELIPSGRVHEGHAEVMAYYRKGRSVFPDQRNEFIAMHHAADSVIVEFWLRGTHLGGRNPNGKAFECRMCAIFEFDAADLITCERVYFDQATITAQLSGA